MAAVPHRSHLIEPGLQVMEIISYCALRTGRCIERPTRQELKRRTVKVRVFPNLDSLLRLSTAVPVEIDEKRETETKAYIKWEGLDE